MAQRKWQIYYRMAGSVLHFRTIPGNEDLPDLTKPQQTLKFPTMEIEIV